MTFLTGAHSGLGRFRHDARSVDERVSLTAVVEAIADIMGDVNRGGVVDRALASRIGGEVQVAVAQAVGTGRISSTTQLVGQQAFWNIVSQHLASTSSAYTDQQARQALLHYMRTQANRTGPDFANFVAQFRRGGGYADRSGDRDGNVSLTSARFDGFSGADAALLSAMRRSALDAGLHWAADRPEILRTLGHEGIRALRDANFRRESFQALRQVGFQEQDAARIAVGIARHANQHGLDANELARQVARGPGVLGGGNATAEQEWRDRMIRFFANPNDEEARRDMGRALNEVESRGTPAQREYIERMRPLLRLEAQATAELHTATVQANTADAQVDGGIDALNDPAPAAPRPVPPPQPTPHVAGPR